MILVGENIDLYCTASIRASGPTQLGAGWWWWGGGGISFGLKQPEHKSDHSLPYAAAAVPPVPHSDFVACTKTTSHFK